ncbi:DNA recombination and repair protein RecF [hydrothermal vent metagenome]|uniref:DNA replication and repair protein RecF n=1 Tax=hydrothermal vent metagenome TaxID=652676 RepID=A0A3B0YYN5_9ZZZZ
MSLKKIQINNFRLFDSVSFSPSQDLNIIYGDNASGKTTLLEAIYFLSRGRSFRTKHSDRLVKIDTDYFQLVAKIKYQNREIVTGIKREQKKTQVRFDGNELDKLSRLSSAIPVQLIQPDSHKLVEDGPSIRRQFLDWGVFHNESSFKDLWSRYRHVLKQRNAALRQQMAKSLIVAWDSELAETGNMINVMRLNYVQQLMEILPDYIQYQLGKIQFEINYYKGWKNEFDFHESLNANLSQDMDRGFTTTGAHRADLKFKVDGLLAQDKLSRGQQKILVSTLLLVQARLFQLTTGRKCILLIDDVAAELDEVRRDRLIDILQKNSFQLFVTSIEQDDKWQKYSEDKLIIECSNAQANILTCC